MCAGCAMYNGFDSSSTEPAFARRILPVSPTPDVSIAQCGHRSAVYIAPGFRASCYVAMWSQVRLCPRRKWTGMAGYGPHLTRNEDSSLHAQFTVHCSVSPTILTSSIRAASARQLATSTVTACIHRHHLPMHKLCVRTPVGPS